VITNILTVDFEEWFVVENLRGKVTDSEWEGLTPRIEENGYKILELFNAYQVQATFFILGWIAEKYPNMVAAIARNGHEIGCHSYGHRRVDTLSRDEFEKDTRQAVKVIKEASGVVPVGYRAPSWSINSKIPWAFEVLADLGFLYDSSIFPIKHDIYGEPDAPRSAFRMKLDSGKLLYEMPASTVSMWGKNFPVGGGGYLRHAPYWFTSWMIRRQNNKNRPVIIYIHPWEIDENHPRIDGLTQFQKYRQYGSISTLMIKLEKLLQEFDFSPAKDYINQLIRKPIGFER